MNNFIYAFIISLIAGLGTLIGLFFIYIKPKNINKYIGLSLSFSATIMLLISIFELIPNGFFYLTKKYNAYYASLILLFMIVFTYFINGFINYKINNKVKEKGSLYKIGILSMIALMIHNLPEGILTFLSTTTSLKLGMKLGLTILLHNIPEGIAIAVPIYYSTKRKGEAFKCTLLSSLSEPLGAIIAYLLLYPILSNSLISYILLFVAGIMISISINDIYNESIKYSKKSLIIGFIIGLLVFILTEFL